MKSPKYGEAPIDISPEEKTMFVGQQMKVILEDELQSLKTHIDTLEKKAMKHHFTFEVFNDAYSNMRPHKEYGNLNTTLYVSQELKKTSSIMEELLKKLSEIYD
tara:strand:+ start:69 stop:380 length:312 start_codon:yes stop_codon:yes gene_type:complete